MAVRWQWQGVLASKLACLVPRMWRKAPRTAKDGRSGLDEILQGYRQSIDNIDAALVFMLAERFKITQAVGRHKAENALPPADPGREEAQIARLRRLAEEAQLDPDFTEKFLRFIIDEVIRHHERLREG
jgi:chorismate mutase